MKSCAGGRRVGIHGIDRVPERMLAETTMSNPHLPADIHDHIVDHLYDTQDVLRSCCLVSKSWVPRARKYLFSAVVFSTVGSLQSWKETFPDPLTSPASYVKALLIDCPQVATVGSWIRDFSCVEHLGLGAQALDFDFNESPTPLVPFHGFSPVLKFLRVVILAFPSSQIFNLILSFPLLEDLVVVIHREMSAEEEEMLSVTQPSSSPRLTGVLHLYLPGGMEPFTRRLTSLPGGIHFRELTLTWFHEKDLSMTTALVEGCSHTLESLDIACRLHGASIQHLPHR
jgi:hypothetical protein